MLTLNGSVLGPRVFLWLGAMHLVLIPFLTYFFWLFIYSLRFFKVLTGKAPTLCVFFFWPQGMWITSSWPGIKPTPPALEGEVNIRCRGVPLLPFTQARCWAVSTYRWCWTASDSLPLSKLNPFHSPFCSQDCCLTILLTPINALDHFFQSRNSIISYF